MSEKSELDVFQEFLRKRGMRNTREREAILQEIVTFQGHFDVDELFIRMKKKNGVSKASIYRTIPLMIDAGLVSEVYLENGHMHYEHVFGQEQHCHLRCCRCNTIIEFVEPRLREIAEEISRYYNFAFEGQKMEIIGRCPSCVSS